MELGRVSEIMEVIMLRRTFVRFTRGAKKVFVAGIASLTIFGASPVFASEAGEQHLGGSYAYSVCRIEISADGYMMPEKPNCILPYTAGKK